MADTTRPAATSGLKTKVAVTMLDQEAMQIARKRLTAETARRHHFFRAELQRVQGELATRGLGHSGALTQAVADVCAKEIEDAADRLWEVVRELLRETNGAPSDEAVRTPYGQIDELWVPYCSAEPERQFEAVCQRDGISPPVKEATNFYNRSIGARMRRSKSSSARCTTGCGLTLPQVIMAAMLKCF